MKLLFKILKLSALAIAVLLFVLFTASLSMQDKVAGAILRSLGKDISTRFGFEKAKLSFIRKFPKASLELKDVVVFSSPGYNRSCFTGLNTDTLLKASSVSADFRITDFLKGKYIIETISVRDGQLNLFTDTSGRVNYEIYLNAKETDTASAYTIDLNRINVVNLGVIYQNLATKLLIKGSVDDGRLKSRISSSDIDFSAEGDLRIDYFKIYDFIISRSINARSDLTLSRTEQGITFGKSTLSLDNYLFGLSGTISRDNVYDLTITGDKIDIAIIRDYLPWEYRERLAAYDPSGILNIRGMITGSASRTINPAVDIRFDMSDGIVSYGLSSLTLKNLALSGAFTNGGSRSPSTSSLSIEGLSAMLGSSRFEGSFLLKNFRSPFVNLKLKGEVIPAEIKEFFNLSSISSAGGTADMVLELEGQLPEAKNIGLTDLFSLSPRAEFKFNSFSAGMKTDSIRIQDLSGDLSISQSVTAKNIIFTFRDHKIALDGSFTNLPEWISGADVTMTGMANIHCTDLDPEKLFNLSSSVPDSDEKTSGAIRFPSNIILDFNLKADNFKYRTFEAGNINGIFSYKPGILNFKSLTFNSLDGMISGDGFIAQNKDLSFMGRGSFMLDGINVNKTFVSFNNFGQDFIRSENLAGTLSGSLSLLMPMDTLLHPIVKSITAEGKYTLVSGALIDFEPVKELSSFIELSELQDIHFDKLENDFFIRNNYLFTPQMEVKSSAANLSVNGKHSFINDYEYHIKILLSEALSRKIRKPRPNTTEFGAVQDDGLGRTSLLLKIENRGEDVKVSYDIKAAGAQVRNEIKSERQNLKSILNEEYGWYRNDTTVSTPRTSPAKKFRITWEEADTGKIDRTNASRPDEGGIRNLFRKKQN